MTLNDILNATSLVATLLFIGYVTTGIIRAIDQLYNHFRRRATPW